MILFRADLRKDQNTRARVRNCKIRALSAAFWHILCVTLVSQSTSGTDTIPLRDRYVCARARALSTHTLARVCLSRTRSDSHHHGEGPPLPACLPAQRAESEHLRNRPSHSERPRSDRETLPERSPGREVRAREYEFRKKR